MARAFDGFETTCIKFPGGRPQGAQMPRPWDRQPVQMPGGGGMSTGRELTDALSLLKGLLPNYNYDYVMIVSNH